MKSIRCIMLLPVALLACGTLYSQKGKIVLNTNEIPEETHVNLDDFPKDQILPMIHGWGGMTVDFNSAPKGTDWRPLLKGMENDHCQVPHWGYIIKGAVQIEYEDGTSEVFKENEAFYMKPGHTGEVLEDLLLVSCSPEDGMHDLAKHLEKRVAELQAEQSQEHQ